MLTSIRKRPTGTKSGSYIAPAKIGVAYAGERLNHVNGTPRENSVPPVLADVTERGLSRHHDPIFEVGYKKLNQLIHAQPNKGARRTRATASLSCSLNVRLAADARH
jgi:hypothetical protein